MSTLRGVSMTKEIELSSAKVIHKIYPDPDKLLTLVLKVDDIEPPKQINSKFGPCTLLKIRFLAADGIKIQGRVFGDDLVQQVVELLPVGAITKLSFHAYPPYRQLEKTDVKFEVRITPNSVIARPDM